MNEQLKRQAEKIFREKLMKSYLDFGYPEPHAKLVCDAWFESLANTNLLYEVIIPSIVQALEFRKQFETEQSDIDAERFASGTPKAIEANSDSAKNAHTEIYTDTTDTELANYGVTGAVISSKPPSKIQPGQKLKDGDCITFAEENQYRELYSIFAYASNSEICVDQCCEMNTMVFSGGFLIWNPKKCRKEYSFEDFKQLCINTFGDGK